MKVHPFIFQCILLLFYVFPETAMCMPMITPWCTAPDVAAFDPVTFQVKPYVPASFNQWTVLATVSRIGCCAQDCCDPRAPFIWCYMFVMFAARHVRYFCRCHHYGGSAICCIYKHCYICYGSNNRLIRSPACEGRTPPYRSLL